jgi:putative ABC transport system permease protein
VSLFLSDLRHALRKLVRAPGFATIAVVTLALGVGANTAIFSIVKAVILAPLPFRDADRVAMIWGALDGGETTWLSSPEIQSYDRDAGVFEDVAAYSGAFANLTGGEEPERVVAAAVTPNLFHTLGVPALLGRTFAPSDSATDLTGRVILGHGLWQRRFGGDPAIVGRSIQVNGSARTVTAVMPASFKLPLDVADDRPSELWVPLNLHDSAYDGWGNRGLMAVVRLPAGMDPERAAAQMRVVEERWVQEGHLSNRQGLERRPVLVKDLVLGDVRSALWLLLGAVGVILLIACANVANLTLARSDERHREVAVRMAIGASRGRIVRQLLTESLLVAAIGGIVGIALAYAGTQLLVAVRPAGIPRVELVTIDVGVLGFSLLLALLTGIAFGLAPALELSRPDLNRGLKDGGRTGTAGGARQRFRDSLVVAQMAMSVVLLIGAMLLTRSFIELRRIDLGFRSDSALSVRVALPTPAYADPPSVTGFHRTLRQRLAQAPGVISVGATRLLPLTGTIGDWSITLEGRVRVASENPNGDWQIVTPGYFETMGIRLVRGRFMTDDDHERTPVIAVINETMANRYWPNEEAIGKRFRLGTDPSRQWITIVGIAGQVRHNAITETPRAEMYIPHAQWPVAVPGSGAGRGMTFVIRTAGDPLAAVPHVRAAVRALDPNMPIADIRTLDGVTDDSLARPRFTTFLLGLFAALALTLATIGIYGVISLLVTRRRQEIGIRMALGAAPIAIVRMILRRGAALAATGVAVGLIGAALLSRVVASMLYSVTPFDPLTFATIPLVLLIVALVATLIPAGRAATVDPVMALRDE